MIHIRTGFFGATGVFRAFAPAETILSSVTLPKFTRNSPRYFNTTRSNYLTTPAFVTGIASKFRKDPPPTVAVLRLAGTIADGRGGPGSRRVNYDSLSKQIDKAFEHKNLKAVCLRINSPGGSPVQSELIAKRWWRSRKESDHFNGSKHIVKSRLVFTEEICSSEFKRSRQRKKFRFMPLSKTLRLPAVIFSPVALERFTLANHRSLEASEWSANLLGSRLNDWVSWVRSSLCYS